MSAQAKVAVFRRGQFSHIVELDDDDLAAGYALGYEAALQNVVSDFDWGAAYVIPDDIERAFGVEDPNEIRAALVATFEGEDASDEEREGLIDKLFEHARREGWLK